MGNTQTPVYVTPWQSQRIRDLLFTLRDIDGGENVSVEEIAELASLFPEDPSVN